MRSYIGTFVKADGSTRTMNFVRLEDLPDEFLSARIKGDPPTEARIKAKTRMVTEGKETVWDLEKNEFRVFNWQKTVDDVLEEEIENFFKNNT